MAAPLYTIEPYSPTANSAILPNISNSRNFSRPYADPYTHPHTLLFTTTPHLPNASPTSTSNSASDRTGTHDHIARPPNAFLLFRSAFLKDGRVPAHAEARQQNLSKVIGQCWNMMPLEERAVWDAKAEEVKQAHMVRYPGYKFRPVPRVRAPPRRVSAAARTPDEKAQKEKEREEATRKLREEFTEYKGEPVMSKRNSKKLARSVRGTERATRPSRKAAASTAASTSTTTPPSTLAPTSTSTPVTTAPTTSIVPTTSTTPAVASTSTSASTAQQPARPIFTTLLSPLPIRAHAYPFAHFAHSTNLTPFLPSSTHLTPAPSAGPQITRITQSPPLTPFHPSDRQPQLQRQYIEQQIQQSQQSQLPQLDLGLDLNLGLCEPAAGPAQWDLHQERAAFEMGNGMDAGMGDKFDAFNPLGEMNMSVCQDDVYPAMDMSMGENYASSNASAYFNGTGGGLAQASDLDLSMNMHANMQMNASMHQYLNLDDAGIDYSAFTNSYMCTAAPATPATPVEYDSPAAFSAFSPAVSSSPSSSSPSSSMSSSSSFMSPTSESVSPPVSPISNGSPASLAYPDSPITPITPVSASGFLDSPATLVYPFPSASPDPGSVGELTLTYPYPSNIYNHDHNNHSHGHAYDENHNQHDIVKFDERDNQLLRLGGLSMGMHGAHGDADGHDHWSEQLGAGVLEVEFGRMGYF